MMHSAKLLVVIGAGASYDSWPPHIPIDPLRHQRIPMANELFDFEKAQNALLNDLHLLGLAAKLRRKARSEKEHFDIEAELANINNLAMKSSNLDDLQKLFVARFYIHSLITDLTEATVNHTHGHTSYIDLINQLQAWITKAPGMRSVVIVSFNYDDLLERAMANVYNFNWEDADARYPIAKYYQNRSMKVFKPHGSINWGVSVSRHEESYRYNTIDEISKDFYRIKLGDEFEVVNNNLFRSNTSKSSIPAIAIPYKDKTGFSECPSYMYDAMMEELKRVDKIITLGWKGGEQHFTSLLARERHHINELIVVSPNGQTQLDSVFTNMQIKKIKKRFSEFVDNPEFLEQTLDKIDPRGEALAEHQLY